MASYETQRTLLRIILPAQLDFEKVNGSIRPFWPEGKRYEQNCSAWINSSRIVRLHMRVLSDLQQVSPESRIQIPFAAKYGLAKVVSKDVNVVG
jgi:hypothetical protein